MEWNILLNILTGEQVLGMRFVGQNYFLPFKILFCQNEKKVKTFEKYTKRESASVRVLLMFTLIRTQV